MSMHKLQKLARIKDGTSHSVYGASGSKMFLNCAGSLVPNLLVQDEGSREAAYGTVAHTISEAWLRHGKDAARSYLGKTVFVPGGEFGFAIKVDREMLDYVWESVGRFLLLSGDRLIETWVDYSRLTPIPNQGGTLDVATMRLGHANVGDHKYGIADPVYAERNPQLMLYALGLLYEWDWLYDFRSFTLTIHQPRLNHFDSWDICRDELLEFAGWAKARMHMAWDLHAPRTPSPEACKWCKVRGDCAPHAKMMVRLQADFTEGVFNQINTEEEVAKFKIEIEDDLITALDFDPMRLTTAHMAALLKYRSMNEKWWNAMVGELMRRRRDGAVIPDYKLVEGRTHRQFVDTKKAIEFLVDLGIPRPKVEITSTVSPAEAQKLIVKHADIKAKDAAELLADIVRKPRGKPTLVPAKDRRPELVDLSNVAWGDGSTETDEIEE